MSLRMHPVCKDKWIEEFSMFLAHDIHLQWIILKVPPSWLKWKVIVCVQMILHFNLFLCSVISTSVQCKSVWSILGKHDIKKVENFKLNPIQMFINWNHIKGTHTYQSSKFNRIQNELLLPNKSMWNLKHWASMTSSTVFAAIFYKKILASRAKYEESQCNSLQQPPDWASNNAPSAHSK